MTRLSTKLASVLGVALIAATLASGPAEARRGGSFGSRGMRTYSAPRTTQTAPGYVAPVQRSMTAPQSGFGAAQAPNRAPASSFPQQQPRRGGMFGGFGGGLMGGLLAGGLIGAMMGHGWGGGLGGGMMGGLGSTLMQVLLFGGIAFLLFSLFRRRQQPQPAGFGREAYAGAAPPFGFGQQQQQQEQRQGYSSYLPTSTDIELTPADRAAFERMLAEVQDAFGREDYGALRRLTTPEVMSYLSEELSQNAVEGRRNQVSDVRLLQADIAEAWSEGDEDYATAAMRYESIDVMRDRQTGTVVSGDPAKPTTTVELWTFVRAPGVDWKLSAIQEAN